MSPRSNSGRETQSGVATLDLAKPATISVNTTSGNISVVTADNSDAVHVSSDDEEPADLYVATDGNDVQVNNEIQIGANARRAARELRRHFRHGFDPHSFDPGRFLTLNHGSSDLRVEIPKGLAAGSRLIVRTNSGDIDSSDLPCSLAAMSQSGDIEIGSVAGDAEVVSVSGDITVQAVSGNLTARSTNGDIRVDESHGHLNVHSVSGDIELKDASPRSLEARSSSGDITIDGAFLHLADYSATSSSGDINVHVDLPESGALLTLHTVSGDKDIKGPWTLGGRRSRAANDDLPRVRLHSTSGDVTAIGRPDSSVPEAKADAEATKGDETSPIWRDGDSWVFEFDNPDLHADRIADITTKISDAVNKATGSLLASVPMPGEPAKEDIETRRLHLLQAVERGEMSVDEALRQLEQE